MVCIVIYVIVIRDPWEWGRTFGATAIMAVFLTVLVLVFGTIGYVMESRPLPAALDFVGFRRLPVVLALVVWGVASHQFAVDGYHDLKTTGEALPPAPQQTVQRAFTSWIEANLGDVAPSSQPSTSRPATPMVFVAAAGGGIKAAAFTSATIDCIFIGTPSAGAGTDAPYPSEVTDDACATGDNWQRLFAASGASGGSVGIASVLAQRATGEVPDGWVKDQLGRDLLSPEIAWQLFVEVPNAVVTFNPSLDRGEVLQESWRRELADDGADPGGMPFFADRSQEDAWADPLVFFSGTNLNDGCRVNISPARSAAPGRDTSVAVDAADPPVLGPLGTRHGPCKDQRVERAGVAPDQAGTRDLVDFLCGDNIDLATAAFLSARFPFVSPTGTIRCPDEGDDDDETIDSLSIGDGGYRDNSGAASIMDTWAVLEPLVAAYNAEHEQCIVPLFVEINNGYAGLGGPGVSSDVAQLVAPALGAARVFSDLSYGPIEQAAAEFSRELAPDLEVTSDGKVLRTRFFRVSLVDHPGVTAPLGWSLSGAAVDDLVGQLGLEENKVPLTSLRDLLAPGRGSRLTCESV